MTDEDARYFAKKQPSARRRLLDTALGDLTLRELLELLRELREIEQMDQRGLR